MRPKEAQAPGAQCAEEPLTTQQTTAGQTAVHPATPPQAPAAREQAEQPHAATFRDLGVAEAICTALDAAGIVTTFPIQALALPLAISGQDIIGQARTGTGKTLAFGVPLLQRLAAARGSGASGQAPSALVVVPTRELAIQVAEDISQAGREVGAQVLTVYGGRAYEPQIAGLKAGIDIVVGTPGRLLDLAERRHLDLSRIRALVLDEADKMLDLGFLPDVERILRFTPDDRQTMLFSATMPGEVVTLARRHLRRPTNVRAEQPDESAPPPLTAQHAYRTHHLDKIEVLARVLQAKDRGLAMVFCQTKRGADQVSTALGGHGFATAAVHGDLGQAQRERALRAFRGGKVDVLVATEVAARGIDVDDVTHVVNYECPDDEKTYVHRIGRTGRAGRAGVAVTFVDWSDMQRWKLISEALGLGMPEPAETYSTSEHLYSELSIPPDATGILPRELRARAGLSAEAEEDLGETGRVRSRRAASAGRDRPRRGRIRDHDTAQAAAGTRAPDAPTGHPTRDAGGPARSRRRRRLRGGLEVPADSSADVTAKASAGAEADASRAGDGAKGRSGDGTGRDEGAPGDTRPAPAPAAIPPAISMPAAPGVPAVIFRTPAESTPA